MSGTTLPTTPSVATTTELLVRQDDVTTTRLRHGSARHDQAQ